MSIHRVGRRRGMLAEINVVPYIDVMLVLVVILMCAAPMVNPSLVDLPSVAKGSRSPDKVVQVVVYPDSKLSVKDGKELVPVDITGLVAMVHSAAQKAGKDVPVVIAADRNVRYEQVVEVMKRLQQAEVHRVALSLKIEK